MTALLRYDIARRAVAEAKTFDEVRDWEDKAAAMQEYCRRARDRTLELDAMEIRTQARRRRGQLILELKAGGNLYEGQPTTVREPGQLRVTLNDMGISRNESARDQKIAALDDNSYTRLVARCRAYAEANPEKHSVFDVLRPPDQPINGARAIMGSRQEPDDSLDFFPTPPWATRALMQDVMPAIGVEEWGATWDPACGQGHMSRVLAEYAEFWESDIFDYGIDAEVLDFLGPEAERRAADWIITNPPFGEKAVQFVKRALTLARRGVAMFVRLQWIESKERYDAIFRETPPTYLCPFVERVNLCKGKWDPDGTTATAYCWLVWKNDEDGWPRDTFVFWIPPGRRESLTRATDRANFAPWSIETVDADTGEILTGASLRAPADQPAPSAPDTPNNSEAA